MDVCIDDFVKDFFDLLPGNSPEDFVVCKFPNYSIDHKKNYSVDSFCVFINKPTIAFSTKKNGWSRLLYNSYLYGSFENKLQISEGENKFLYILKYISSIHKIFPNCALFMDNLEKEGVEIK